MNDPVLAFADVAPISVYVAQDGVFQYVNPQFERDTGYSNETLAGAPRHLLVAPEDLAMLKGHEAASLAGKLSAPYQYRMRTRSGQVRWVLERVTGFTFRGGPASMGFLMDITERRRSEEARHEAEAKFRALVESAPDALLVVDADGRMALVNAQAEALFGYDRKELIGQRIEMLIPERFRNTHMEHRAGYRRAPVLRPLHSGLKLYGTRKDGTEFPVDISLSPVKTEEGTQVIAVVRDTSERARVHQEMERVILDLKADLASRSAEILVAAKDSEGLAHASNPDLRATLQAMESFSRIVDGLGNDLPSDARPYLETMRENAKRMVALIDGLLAARR